MSRTVLCLALVAVAAGAAADENRLFTIEGPLERTAVRSMKIVDAAEGYRIHLDTEAVRSNPEALTIDLPDGRSLEAERKRFREYGPSWKTWSGEVRLPGGDRRERDQPGYLFLTDHGDAVTGILNLASEQYQIQAVGGGHRLIKLGERSGPTCGVETAGGVELVPRAWPGAVPAGDAGGGGADRPAPGLAPKSTIRIDLLALYPAAITGWADQFSVVAFVFTSVGIANDVFANSGIDAEYNLVGTRRLTGPSQPSPGTFGFSVRRALDWLDDQHFVPSSEVVNLRNTYDADMVALFIPRSWPETVCAVANLPERLRSQPSSPSTWVVRNQGGLFGTRAFTAHRVGCGLNDFTLAHELGHNFGMRHHDEGTTTTTTNPNAVREHLFPHGRGGNDMFGGQASVMGCELSPSAPPDRADTTEPLCNRHPRFSNRAGVQRNNVAVANAQLPIFASFQPQIILKEPSP